MSCKKIKESKPVVLIGEPQYSEKPVRALAAETGVPAVQLGFASVSAPLNAPARLLRNRHVPKTALFF